MPAKPEPSDEPRAEQSSPCMVRATALAPLLALHIGATSIAMAQEAVPRSVPCDPNEQRQSVHLAWDENLIRVTIGEGECLCDDSESRIKAFLQDAVRDERGDQLNSDKRWRHTIELSPAPGETTEPRVVYCYTETVVNTYLKESGLPELASRDLRGGQR